MSPVLAAALARAEAADALPFDADFASAFDADDRPFDAEFASAVGVVPPPFARSARDASPPRRVSKTPGRFLRLSGCFGHSAQRGEGRRS